MASSPNEGFSGSKRNLEACNRLRAGIRKTPPGKTGNSNQRQNSERQWDGSLPDLKRRRGGRFG